MGVCYVVIIVFTTGPLGVYTVCAYIHLIPVYMHVHVHTDTHTPMCPCVMVGLCIGMYAHEGNQFTRRSVIVLIEIRRSKRQVGFST